MLRNLDAYYLAVDSYFEFPEIEEHEVRQLVYDEFGYERFENRTFHLTVVITLAKTKYEQLLQKYSEG